MISKVQCPAKVNLFLEVTGKRRDGYHSLATLFAKISLFDSLEIEDAPSAGPVELAVDHGAGIPVPEGPDNLVLRAAEAFRKAFRVRCGVRIRLRKNIPVGAGLGGGSSDAAGTLVGMARVFKIEQSGEPKSRVRAKLRRLAKTLGADVPFFLQEKPFCLGRGIGDELTPVSVPKALPWMVLVYPKAFISTAKVYQQLVPASKSDTLTRLAQLGTLKKKLHLGRPAREWAGLLFNRLENAVLPSHPGVHQAKRVLQQLGAQGALMSGSGSSVFGFTASHEEGERIRKRLQGYPWQVFVTCCLG